MPEKHDHELEAVTALIPLLGPMVGEPVRVDGRNNEHPGQTFDFALRRRNTRLAGNFKPLEDTLSAGPAGSGVVTH